MPHLCLRKPETATHTNTQTDTSCPERASRDCEGAVGAVILTKSEKDAKTQPL